jgi:hypothetical protein
MGVPVTGPDGKQYQFPDGTTKEAAIAYFKKKGIGVKSAETPSALSRLGSSYASGAGVVSQEEGKRFFTHPLETIKGMAEAQGELGAQAGRELKSGDYVRGITHGIEYLIPGMGPTLAHAGEQAENKDYAGAIGTTLGAATTLALDPERVVGATERGLSKVGQLRKAAAEKAQPFARKVAGVEPAVKEAVTKAGEKQTEKLAERPAQLKEHFDKTQAVKEANTEAETAQSRKAAIDSGMDKLSQDFSSELNALEKKVRGEANEKYAAVREKVGDATVPRENLANSVRKAEAKLQGSSENIKVFRDIMSKTGDDTVTSGGMDFGPGTPVYESVKNSPGGLPNAAEPATFADLQGYYSELGDKLSSGNLPGDVYQAMKGLREDVGGMMQEMADSRGASAELKQAQKFYHDYMETFREPSGPSGSGSPVAQARLAKDPAYVRKPFVGDSGARGVEMLAKYSPDLAKKARAIAKYQTEADAIPSRAPKVKEPPPVPAKPETPTVDVNKVAREAIATRAKNWGSFNARDIGILSASAIGGVLEAILSGRGGYELPVAAVTYEGGKYAASRVLNKPAVVEWLSRTPPEEIAVLQKIPGADKVRIVDGLTEAAIESGKTGKPVSLSPQARSFLGPANVARIVAASGIPNANPVKNRKEALELLGQPAH